MSPTYAALPPPPPGVSFFPRPRRDRPFKDVTLLLSVRILASEVAVTAARVLCASRLPPDSSLTSIDWLAWTVWRRTPISCRDVLCFVVVYPTGEAWREGGKSQGRPIVRFVVSAFAGDLGGGGR